MNFYLGFSAEYYATFVDPQTFRDSERFEITGGKIAYSDSSLRESADIECVKYEAGEKWVRIYLVATQQNTPERFALFTGLASSPEDAFDGYMQTNTVALYSVLKPADDVLLQRGWYAPYMINGGEIIKKLLRTTPAPVIIDDDCPNLLQSIIAEDGETHLTMVNKILKAINRRLKIDGFGHIHICKEAIEPSAYYDDKTYDAIEPKITRKHDWFSCPNVFRAISEGTTAVARDDSAASALSTVNRGREIWMEETSVKLSDGETVADYALRRLKEEQAKGITINYDRRYNPDLRVTDIVHLNYPAIGIKGYHKVVSQTVTLGYGCSTSEEVTKL